MVGQRCGGETHFELIFKGVLTFHDGGSDWGEDLPDAKIDESKIITSKVDGVMSQTMDILPQRITSIFASPSADWVNEYGWATPPDSWFAPDSPVTPSSSELSPLYVPSVLSTPSSLDDSYRLFHLPASSTGLLLADIDNQFQGLTHAVVCLFL